MRDEVIKQKILVVDDDEDMRYIVARTLEKMGYEVLGVESSLKAIRAVAKQRFSLAIVDIKMADMGGPEAIVEMRKYDPQMPVVLITGSPDWPDRELRVTCQGCLYKPFRLEQLRSLVQTVLGGPSQKVA
ncbi:MAG: response regulator [Anaerolineae bacterium]|nr:response regulator [Anaerolineae bacterium]